MGILVSITGSDLASYATGNVSGPGVVGGLVGQMREGSGKLGQSEDGTVECLGTGAIIVSVTPRDKVSKNGHHGS